MCVCVWVYFKVGCKVGRRRAGDEVFMFSLGSCGGVSSKSGPSQVLLEAGILAGGRLGSEGDGECH